MHNLNCNYSQTRVNTDTQGAIESVLVNEVSVLVACGDQTLFSALETTAEKSVV